MSKDLEPIDPETAVEMYLDDRRHNVAEATLRAHHYRLKQFIEWCQAQGIENLNNLTGRDLHNFRVKRRNEDELATATMKGQLATLRMLLRFAVTIDAVEPQLDEKIILPKTTEEDARDEMLETDQAKQILEHLDKYEYATLEHALIETLWHTGIRIGGARSLDAEDYNSEEQYLVLEHDSEQDTPLKNGKQGERLVAVNDRVCRVLEDWLDVNHPGVTDDYGRTPLFATKEGRLSRNHGRSIAYQTTRPCTYTDHCPHDRDMDACEGLNNSRAYECPTSLSPHPIRRGAITHYLQADTPEKIVSKRMNVGSDVLSRHYDQRTEIEKLRQRRQYLPGNSKK